MFGNPNEKYQEALEEIIKLKNEKSQLIEWLDTKIKEYHAEADLSGMFSSSFWKGKEIALEIVKAKLVEQKP